jgi:hypothetical protein
MIAAPLTVTSKRHQVIDFSQPFQIGNLGMVHSIQMVPIFSLDDLLQTVLNSQFSLRPSLSYQFGMVVLRKG